MTRSNLSFWPLSVPGHSLTFSDGVGATELGRMLALPILEGLIRAHICDATAVLPIAKVNDKLCWAVSGKEWTLEQGMPIAFPEETDFASWGTITLSKGYFTVHSMVVSKSEAKVVLDKLYRFAMTSIPGCLTEMVIDFGQSIIGRQLTDDEVGRINQWGTQNPTAYWSLVQGWFLRVACSIEMDGVTLQDSNDCYDKVDKLDPDFSRFRHELPSRLPPFSKSPHIVDPHFYSVFYTPGRKFSARF